MLKHLATDHDIASVLIDADFFVVDLLKDFFITSDIDICATSKSIFTKCSP